MAATLDLTATRDCACLAARRRARALTRRYERALRPHGLRATQFSILAALAQIGASPVGTLAHALGLERTTLTRSLTLLERNGWIATAASDDARERPIRLTDEGRGTLERAFPAWQAVQEAVLAEATPAASQGSRERAS